MENEIKVATTGWQRKPRVYTVTELRVSETIGRGMYRYISAINV